MTFPKRLDLRGWDPRLDGVGERLQLRFGASRAGRHPGDCDSFRGDVVVTVDRWFVRRLVQAIADMQAADRVRINEEIARLTTEIAPLTSSKPTT